MNLPTLVIPFWKADSSFGMFSKWSPYPVVEDGITFHTSEHYLTYHKAMLFGDPDTANRVLASSDPRQAKAVGRRVRNWDRDIWETNQLPIMVRALWLKVKQHKEIRQLLLQTDGMVLAEASPYDNTWGVGYGPSDKRAHDSNQWKGRNLLGEAWMTVRYALILGSEPILL